MVSTAVTEAKITSRKGCRPFMFLSYFLNAA